MQVLFEVLIELLIEFVISSIGATGRKTKPRLSFQGRLQRARQKRRNRAVRRYLRRGDDSRTIPGIGLMCGHCSYSLAGLTNRLCPKCGHGFALEDYIVEGG